MLRRRTGCRSHRKINSEGPEPIHQHIPTSPPETRFQVRRTQRVGCRVIRVSLPLPGSSPESFMPQVLGVQLLTFRGINLCCGGALLCIVGCIRASLPSTLLPTPPPHCDNQNVPRQVSLRRQNNPWWRTTGLVRGEVKVFFSKERKIINVLPFLPQIFIRQLPCAGHR